MILYLARCTRTFTCGELIIDFDKKKLEAWRWVGRGLGPEQKTAHQLLRCGVDGRMDGWTDGRMDGWTDVKMIGSGLCVMGLLVD